MAESVFSKMVTDAGLEGKLCCGSAAAHRDELGNPPHRGTREKLAAEGVPLVPHRARLLTASDGERYDWLIGMDEANVRDIVRITGRPERVRALLDFTDHPRPIADPWYTGDFDRTYEDIKEGCAALLRALQTEIV